jgi:hypothetical protein
MLKNPAARTATDDMQGYWTVARPGTTEDFIAAGCYFGKSIQRERQKPVGLIKVAGPIRHATPTTNPASRHRRSEP